MPFIEAGYVNFIPDPCAFDDHLQRQMFSMAEMRSASIQMSDDDASLIEWMQKDDFERMLSMLPKDAQIAQIRKATPKLSDADLEDLLDFIDERKKADPLTLLQKDVYSGVNGGQMNMLNMAPNFEMAMYIAQATGSFLVTDSLHRWKEIKSAQFKVGGVVRYEWNELTRDISLLNHSFLSHPEKAFQARVSGKAGKLRKSVQNVFDVVRRVGGTEDKTNLASQLRDEFVGSHEVTEEEMKDHLSDIHCVNMEWLIPKNGIWHANAQRLLLSGGNENHVDRVPFAILMKHAKPPN